jgi:protein phosphatase
MQANHELLAEASKDVQKLGMGTTIVAATVAGDKLYTANVGDSRLYVLNRESIIQITRDHSLVEEMVRMGEMDKEDAKTHPDKNIITRAVGVQEDVAVDLFENNLREGDMILMCSDGLTNMIEDEQRDIAEQAEALIKTANQNGGKDNITVVLVEPFSIGG